MTIDKDMLNRPLGIGDYVSYDDSTYRIEKFTTKMVYIATITKLKIPQYRFLTYSNKLKLLSIDAVLIWLLSR